TRVQAARVAALTLLGIATYRRVSNLPSKTGDATQDLSVHYETASDRGTDLHAGEHLRFWVVEAMFGKGHEVHVLITHNGKAQAALKVFDYVALGPPQVFISSSLADRSELDRGRKSYSGPAKMGTLASHAS